MMNVYASPLNTLLEEVKTLRKEVDALKQSAAVEKREQA
ncbi:hypothetical protein SAMN04515656_10845 [Eubacterium aggregans]|uniref:Uncharacterized protein n=1 Tax=Eubacterium aggregans TaxID=81409 RepID=A0A1H4AG89_9FIRM|nr:hypothetical protein SAMN04515656_10845 [Eubacterium aggregans]